MLSTSHPVPTTISGSGSPRIPQGATVLIIEGDARLRTGLNANFLRHGWRVKMGANLREAFRMLDQHAFDLIVSGITTHDRDLHELIAAQCESVPAAPVIVLAGNTAIPQVVQLMRAGAFDVLAKGTCLEALQVSALNAFYAFRGSDKSDSASEPESANSMSAMTLSQLNRKHLEDALAVAEGNRTTAARALGISVRTVRNKIKQYGLPPRSYA